MPQNPPAIGEDFIEIGDDFTPIDEPSSEPMVITPPLTQESPGIWDTLTSPLTDLPSRIGKGISEGIRELRTSGKSSPTRDQALGFLEGGVEGLGDYVTNLTSPLDLGLSIATAGSSAASRKGLQGIAQALEYARQGFGAGTALRGAQNTFGSDRSIPERAGGALEMVGGLLGMRGNSKLGKVADTVISPEPLPVNARAGTSLNPTPEFTQSVPQVGGKSLGETKALADSANGNPVPSQPPTQNMPVQAGMGNTNTTGNVRTALKNPTPEMIKKAKAAGYDVTFENGKAYVTKAATPTPPESLPILESEVAKAGKPTPARASLQADLRGAKPRYKDSTLEFDNDMDKALYIISNAKSRSIRDKDYLKFVMEQTGLDELGARQLGLEMRQSIKDAMQNAQPGKPVKLSNFFYARQAANPTNPSVPPVMDGTGGNVPPVKPPVAEAIPEGIEPVEHLGDIIDKKKDSPLLEALGLPRAIMTAGDLSMPLRQGKMHVGTKAWRDALVSMFKSGVSEDAFRANQKAIRERPLFKQTFNQRTQKWEKSFAEQAGLKLTDLTDLNSREESLSSTWAEKIPGVRASNRAATTFINNLRTDTFEKMIKTYEVLDGKEPDLSLARSLADFVNSSTGRGDLGKLERSATALNQTLFSPRLVKSRLDMMNPVRFIYAPAPVQKETVKAWLRLTAASLAMAEVAKASGGRMGTDPTNSDFGKIILPGNKTRIDPWAGFQQYAVLATRLATGKRTSSMTGKEFDLDNPRGFNPPSRLGVLGDFARSKANPNIGFMMDILNNMKEPTGKPMDFTSTNPFENSATKMFIPLFIQQAREIGESDPENFGWAIPALFGEGVQTYEKPSASVR